MIGNDIMNDVWTVQYHSLPLKGGSTSYGGGYLLDEQQIDVAALHSFYRGVSDLIGVERMLKIHDQYRGMQITIPIHLYDREVAARHVLEQYDGHNSYELANQYGYSQRWVNKVVKTQADKQ